MLGFADAVAALLAVDAAFFRGELAAFDFVLSPVAERVMLSSVFLELVLGAVVFFAVRCTPFSAAFLRAAAFSAVVAACPLTPVALTFARGLAEAEALVVLPVAALLSADLGRLLGDVAAAVERPSASTLPSVSSSGRLRFWPVEPVAVFAAARFESDAVVLLRDREEEGFRIVAVPFGGGTMRSSCAAGTFS